ncbi:restriction endonuclease subunit S [uncultured Microbacterium sp.]|uniref:restriction endonuclease subunit S n=1 Tax=uncultured Microbacterium sp. TaxID=191216 RepID=UPI0025E7E9A3|nr:restriction endonuclease subunit S [uncultured Microbacterium sp.]
MEKYRYFLAKDLTPLLVDGGDIKILTTSESDLWTTEEAVGGPVHDAEVVAIPWGGNAIVQYHHGKFITSDNRIAIANDSSVLDMKYLYYFLQAHIETLSSFYRGSGIKHPSMARVLDWQIPVPPLEVQREIVRILDQFTHLEAVLKAELEARRVQHAHYWNVLLTPDTDWSKLTVGDVSDVFDGPHATPKKTADGPWYLSISSLQLGRFRFAESAHLDDADLPRWTRRVAPRRGDTLFSYETRLGQAALWESDEPAALGRRMGLLRPKQEIVDPRFLTLAYLGPQFQSVIRANTVTGSTVDRIPIADMASWEIQIPSLEKQRRIVRTLDTFDTLVNDLKIGLPAQINARRKQFEYYRGKLLTFEETTA